MGQWLFHGSIALGLWLFHGSIALGQWMWTGGIELGKWMWDEATSISWSDIQWAGSVTWDAIVWSGSVGWDAIVWSGSVGWDLIMWSGSIGWDQIVWTGSIAWDFIEWTGAINIADHVIGTINLGDYLDFGGGDGGGDDSGTGGGGFDPSQPIATYRPAQHGGVFTEPTRTLIGEGSQSEAVFPLDTLQTTIEQAARTGADQARTEGGGERLPRNTRDTDMSAIEDRLDTLIQEIRALGGDINVDVDGRTIVKQERKAKKRFASSREVVR